jgi:acetyl-CoA carboxylase biotin carboxyl carrier protein
MTQPKKRSAIDLDVVRQLADVLAEAQLTEIEYDTGEWRVRVAKMPASIVAHPTPVASPGAPSPLPHIGVKGGAESEADAYADHPGLLTSPMVGVAYTAPEPTAPAFVKIGDTVAAGDTVLLIEAMKVFNAIKAPRAGRIEQVFVTSGMPVEYGEPLMLIV